jgi:uncharacterized protein (TIGR00269 family)
MIPESETTLYAIITGLKFHDLECPYASEALRNTYRHAVAQLEDVSPGTRHSIIKSYDQILPTLMTMFEPAKLRHCSCGEPTISHKCKACEMIEGLRRE